MSTLSFDRFRPSEDQHSRESGDEDLVSQRYDTDPVLKNSPTDDVVQVHDEDNQSEFDNSAAGSVHMETNNSCTVDWKNFVRMVTSELKINDVRKVRAETLSYLSDRLMGTKSSVPQQSLPKYGYILNILTGVNEEFQRTYKASDDEKYRVASSDF